MKLNSTSKIICLIIATITMSCQHYSQTADPTGYFEAANESNTEVSREIASNKSAKSWGKKEVKKYFLSVTGEQRNEILARAQIFDSNYDPEAISKFNIAQMAKEDCPEYFNYSPTKVKLNPENGYGEGGNGVVVTVDSYLWGKVSCNYHPDVEKSMGGGSKKFLCDFADSNSKDQKSTKKVRYAVDSSRPLDRNSEVVESILASNIARLIGLPTKTFCPAEIQCIGCSSIDPWEDDRASKPASKNTIPREWAIVENTAEAYIVSEKFDGRAPNGVGWEEFKKVTNTTPEKKKEILIEREAWLLWVNFIQNTDMGPSNIRLICNEYEKIEDGKYNCKNPLIYAHDYGHSFHRHLNYQRWASVPVFLKSDKNAGCKAGLTRSAAPLGNVLIKKSPIVDAEFSAEARDLLVRRLERITDSQWIEMFRFSRAEEATKISSATWLKDIKKKIDNMKSAECLPFDSGKSVLFN